MKKITALVLALILMLCAAGCAAEAPADTPAPEETPEGLFYELTGLDPAATLVTVDGCEVPAEMYLYWVLYAADYVEATYAAEFVGEDGRLKWDEAWNEEMTLRDCVLAEALNTVKMYMVVERWADEYGVTLSEESEQAVDAELDAIAEQLGGQEAFEEYLAQRGITPETNRRMSRMFYLYANMLSLTKEEGSPLYIEDDVLYQYEDINEDTVLADHILVAYPENEEERPAVKETMEELRAGICQQEDPVATFCYIADSFSEDPGRAYNPNGYLVNADTPFVQSFKDTAFALEEYEISEVFESMHGYHIMLRRPIRDYVADLYLSDLIAVAVENAQVEWAESYSSFDLASFYAGYQDHKKDLLAGAAAEGESEESEASAAAGEEAGEQ